jgi:hypothetical protein
VDTPNQYIEQCKKAFEIQELWVPTLGDNAVHKYYNRLLYIVIYIGEITIWGWDQKQKLAAFKGKKDLLLWIPLLHQ